MNVFILSSGRSGSTWLFDIFWKSEIFKRNLFEPFKKYEDYFNNFVYLNPNDNNQLLINSFRRCVSYENKDKFSNKYNINKTVENVKGFSFNRSALTPKIEKVINKGDSVLVKEIIINLKLPWILNNIPEFLCFFLFRHPFSVSFSHLKLKWGISTSYMKDKQFFDDIFYRFKKYYREDYSDIEKAIWCWCINNCIPLIQAKGKTNFLFYENFCLYGKQEINKTFNKFNIPVNNNVIKELNVSSPTTVFKNKIHLKTSEELVTIYRKELTNDNKNKCLEIMKIFNAEDLYDWDTFRPNENNFKNYYLRFL